jgi:hypothetical protein
MRIWFQQWQMCGSCCDQELPLGLQLSLAAVQAIGQFACCHARSAPIVLMVLVYNLMLAGSLLKYYTSERDVGRQYRGVLSLEVGRIQIRFPKPLMSLLGAISQPRSSSSRYLRCRYVPAHIKNGTLLHLWCSFQAAAADCH